MSADDTQDYFQLKRKEILDRKTKTVTTQTNSTKLVTKLKQRKHFKSITYIRIELANEAGEITVLEVPRKQSSR